MLTRLLEILDQSDEEIDLIEISRQLGSNPSAVAGMIETLIHMGRLVEKGPGCGPCDGCDVQIGCPLTATHARILQKAGGRP